MKICVLSRIDRRGQPGPDALHLGQRRLRVVVVLARWAEPPYRYFEVRVEDGRRFVLRHDPPAKAWELAAVYAASALRSAWRAATAAAKASAGGAAIVAVPAAAVPTKSPQ